MVNQCLSSRLQEAKESHVRLKTAVPRARAVAEDAVPYPPSVDEAKQPGQRRQEQDGLENSY